MAAPDESLQNAAEHLKAGRVAEAEATLRLAIQARPNFGAAQAMLGAFLQSQNRIAEALVCFEMAVRSEPDSANAHFDLANLRQHQGDLSRAAADYEQALELAPQHVAARVNLGIIRKQQGALDTAIGHFQAALERQPRNAAALSNLGAAYELQGRTDDALAAFRSAVAADPALNIAGSNLGALLQKLGRLDEARACFESLLQANPRFVLALLGLAAVYYKQGDLERALDTCRRALQIDPGSARSHLQLGTMLNEQGRRDEAIEHLCRALSLNPRLPGAHGNLAIALHMTGHIEEAIANHRREIEISPQSSLHHSNLLYCLNFHPSLGAQSIFAEHLAWANRHADPLTAAAAPHTNDRSPLRRLRIGYVSPHFYMHAVNFFSEPIMASHDHSQFEIFCYSDTGREDEATARLRGYADCWRTIVGHGHEQVARQIRADQIDILVDLTGHIGENRMPVFARKPAPVQVTYIGYQNTSGMRAMDYRLTDAHADPPGATERYHTESLVRLPTTFFCYRPPDDAAEIAPVPALARGFPTFASLNNFAKVTPEVLATWAEILRELPRSRLAVLAALTPTMTREVLGAFASHGIGPERLHMIRHLPHAGFVELLAEIDIALDPFPFNGHTTTCECLWHGVPVVALRGSTYVSRFGTSALATLGLQELIADSRAAYGEIAVALAGNLEHLSRLRATLRDRMAASPLLDFTTFTRNLEAEYRAMWRRFCVS